MVSKNYLSVSDTYFLTQGQLPALKRADFVKHALSQLLETLLPRVVTLQKPSFCNRMCYMTGHAGPDFMYVVLEGCLPVQCVSYSQHLEPTFCVHIKQNWDAMPFCLDGVKSLSWHQHIPFSLLTFSLVHLIDTSFLQSQRSKLPVNYLQCKNKRKLCSAQNRATPGFLGATLRASTLSYCNKWFYLAT